MHWQTARSMAWTLASFMRLPCFIREQATRLLSHAHQGGTQPTRSMRVGNHIPDDLLIYNHHRSRRKSISTETRLRTRTSRSNGQSNIGRSADVSGARAGRSYGSWRNVFPKRVVLTLRCAPSSMSRLVSPPTRGSDARKSKRCSEIVMLSLQGARRDNSKDQDLGRSGGGASPSGVSDALSRCSSSCFSAAVRAKAKSVWR